MAPAVDQRLVALDLCRPVLDVGLRCRRDSASVLRTAACCRSGSICTSGAPERTRSPALTKIFVTMPSACGWTVVERRDLSVRDEVGGVLDALRGQRHNGHRRRRRRCLLSRASAVCVGLPAGGRAGEAEQERRPSGQRAGRKIGQCNERAWNLLLDEGNAGEGAPRRRIGWSSAAPRLARTRRRVNEEGGKPGHADRVASDSRAELQDSEAAWRPRTCAAGNIPGRRPVGLASV